MKKRNLEFTKTADSEKFLTLYAESSNTVILFIQDCCNICETNYVPAVDLYNAYNTLAPSTATNYSSILKQISSSAIGKINLENLTSHDVEEYLLSINKKLAPSTVNLTETLLKSALSFAFNEKFIDLIPVWNKVGSAKKPEKRALTVDQRNLFVTYAKTEQIGIALIFQLYSGMRIGEITALRWDDIDFENKILHVRHSTRRENGQYVLCLPKGNKTREIPLHQNLIKLLQRQQEVQKQNKNTKDVFQNKNLVFCTRNVSE